MANDLMSELEALRESQGAEGDAYIKKMIADVRSREPSVLGSLARGVGRGLLTEFDDEAAAAVQTLSTGGPEFDKAQSEYQKLKDQDAKVNPWATGIGTFGGGVGIGIPGAKVLGKGFQAANRLPKGLKTAAKGGMLAAEGGAYGALTGMGLNEGGLVERLSKSGIETAMGALAGPVMGAGGAGVSAGLGKLTGWVKNKFGEGFGSAVNAKISEWASTTGLSTDEIVRRIVRGERLGEMSKTLQVMSRAIKNDSGAAKEILSDVASARPSQTRAAVGKKLNEGMAPGTVERTNLIEKNRNAVGDAKKRISGEYKRIYDEAGPVPESTLAAVEDVILSAPKASKEIAEIIQMRTHKKPFYSVADDGTVEFHAVPTLQDVEILRGSLRDLAKKSRGQAAIGYQDLQKQLRSELDAVSDDLSKARDAWRITEKADEAFEDGRKAFSLSPDEVAIKISNMTEAKQTIPLNSYRAGVAQAMKDKMKTGGAASFVRKMSKPVEGGIAAKEHEILQQVYPSAELDDLMATIRLSTQASDFAGQVNAGPGTAEWLAAGKNLKKGGMVSDMARIAGGDVMGGGMALARKVLEEMKTQFSDAELGQIAKVLISDDPNLVRRALEDDSARRAFEQKVKRVASRFARYGAGGAAVGAPSELDQWITRRKPLEITVHPKPKGN